MSSKYPILENRPIDQWKVTELKEELKRRKLTTKGLKDDLIKRLDEALRIERENNAKDVITGIDLDNQPVDGIEGSEAVPVVTGKAEVVTKFVAEKIEDVGDVKVKVQVDINNSAEVTGEEPRENVVVSGNDSSRVEGELAVPAATLQTSFEVSEDVASEVTLGGQDAKNSETHEENGDLKSQLDNEGSKPQLDNDDSKSQMDSEASKPEVNDGGSKAELDDEGSKPQLDTDVSKSQLDNEDPKPLLENEGLRSPHEDVMHDSSTPNNQVSEVSPNLGFQVKSDSISTDSVSINEKTELKDNIITDNVKLELDVKPEMVEESSNNIVPVGGESHPMDVEEPQEKKASVEEKDDSNATNADISKKNDVVDVGYSEKLNLDRSSGDDSMEEDALESKQIDSKYNSDDIEIKSEKSEMDVVKEENLIDDVGNNLSIDEKEMGAESKTRPAVPAEKRKLNDQAVGSTEPVKRQRRWNSESVKVVEPQSSNLAPTTTPKNVLQPALSRRNLSRSDSSVSNENTPKERIVPPSQRPPTDSLRIDNFLRPFTLKAVQVLLGNTGNVTSFWMDQIKTHCYVSVRPPHSIYIPLSHCLRTCCYDDLIKNCNSFECGRIVVLLAIRLVGYLLLNLQLLVTYYPPPLPPPPPLSNPPPAKERLGHPPPTPLPEKHDPPIVTLDDLFRKTRATPRIYYLPLSEEQVAAKLTERGKNAKQ
eukprot:XP_015580734.1 apoptotic chromatin condensation inducer in the nucleus [Ricinus communis]